MSTSKAFGIGSTVVISIKKSERIAKNIEKGDLIEYEIKNVIKKEKNIIEKLKEYINREKQ